MKINFIILALLGIGLPCTAWSQLNGITFIAGGEAAFHRLVSPKDASGLEFEFGFGRTKAEVEQSFFIGANADWIIKGRFGVQTQIDYGRVIYSVSFRDLTETNGFFGPQTRGLFYAPERVDVSVLPSYRIDLNRLGITPRLGVTYSIPVNETGYVDKIADRPGQERGVAIQNALNRSFGGTAVKLNAGVDISYGRFLLHLNFRHQISSASDGPVEVENVLTPILFDNRLTAFQVGLGYRVLCF